MVASGKGQSRAEHDHLEESWLPLDFSHDPATKRSGGCVRALFVLEQVFCYSTATEVLTLMSRA